MKEIGRVRRIDNLGRIVIPKEIRDTFNINEKDKIRFEIDKNLIILQKVIDEFECLQCGKIIEKQDSYCRYCGKKVN